MSVTRDLRRGSAIRQLYGDSLSLLTDLYQLTMAYGYWKSGVAQSDAVFHLFFRQNPFQGGFTIASGLSHVLDYLEGFRLVESDINYLASLVGNDGKPLFETAFLRHLQDLEFQCDVDGVPEGTVVFPHEPILRVCGPIVQCQLLETPLLNIINFQSLIATKAARICRAARGEPVLEFGLRRAQGIDGGVAASWAAYVGGCAATSNVLAGKLFGIPVRGTHAHSWVMSFDSELEAFTAYAEAMPNNCVFLVDTYDTLEGVHRAVEVGRKLRLKGHEFSGIRLDSGDLAYLSIEARSILDEAGFPNAAIVASNDLDEHIIESLKMQGAQVSVWGVGTKLVTAYDQPALGGVYKLSALRASGGPWEYKIKLSEQALKISTPGLQQVRRFRGSEGFVADMIYDKELGVEDQVVIVDPMDHTRRRTMDASMESADVLVPIFREGRAVYEPPTIHEIREHVQGELSSLHDGIKRLIHPHEYPVGLEKGLYDLKTQLILQARGQPG